MKYGIFEGYDHHNERSLWQVFGKDNDYQGVWHETKEEAIKELEAKLEALQKTVPITLREIEELGKLEAENDRLKKELNLVYEQRDTLYHIVAELETFSEHIIHRVDKCLKRETAEKTELGKRILLARLHREDLSHLSHYDLLQMIENYEPTNNEEV